MKKPLRYFQNQVTKYEILMQKYIVSDRKKYFHYKKELQKARACLSNKKVRLQLEYEKGLIEYPFNNYHL